MMPVHAPHAGGSSSNASHRDLLHPPLQHAAPAPLSLCPLPRPCRLPADNEYSAKPQLAAAHKLPKVLMALRRGSGCFDVGYYLAMSPDVRARSRGEETAAFKHWVFHGQFEDRPFRFVCDDLDYAAIAAPPV